MKTGYFFGVAMMIAGLVVFSGYVPGELMVQAGVGLPLLVSGFAIIMLSFCAITLVEIREELKKLSAPKN